MYCCYCISKVRLQTLKMMRWYKTLNLSSLASEEAIDDVGDKSAPTNHEEMTRKTVTGEQIDTGLMHIPLVKEPAGEPNKFSRWEESPGYKSELKLVQSMKVICALDLLVQLFAQKCRAAPCQLPCIVDLPCVGPVS